MRKLQLFLTKPHLRYKSSFLEAMREVQAEKQSNPFSASMSENKLDLGQLQSDEGFQDFLQRLTKSGRVPNTTFWLIGKADDGAEIFLGRSNVRHYLTKRLRNMFGHISYLIRPSERRKGYGKTLLDLTLLEAKKIITDLAKFDHKVLITCKAKNTISQKIIVQAGGELEQVADLGNGNQQLLYWLPL